MTSRDGLTFRRWSEAFLRPGPRRKDSWVYGDNFIFWGMVQTKSTIEDAPDEISLYATESYWEGPYTTIRRLTLRLDGFVSASAPMTGGELVTKPIRFEELRGWIDRYVIDGVVNGVAVASRGAWIELLQTIWVCWPPS